MDDVLAIVTNDSPSKAVLRRVAAAIRTFDRQLFKLVERITRTMYHEEGIGIAAPQIGKSLKICVVDVSSCISKSETCELDGEEVDIKKISPIVFVNPKIISSSKQTAICEEGCLSVPDIHGKIERPSVVRVKFFDTQNNLHNLQCAGLLAVCVQHEIDHLNGILFIDKLIKK